MVMHTHVLSMTCIGMASDHFKSVIIMAKNRKAPGM